MRRTFVLLLLAALTACASQGIPPERIARIKSVSVVSQLGDELRLQYVGQMVFSNAGERVPVDWNIDQYAQSVFAKRLAAHYEAKTFPYDARSIFKREIGDRAFGLPAGYVERLRGTAQPGFVDAYIVLSAAPSSDEIGDSNQILEGYALYARTKLFDRASRSAAVYLSYRVEVIDGRSFEVISSANGRISGYAPRRSGDLPTRAVNLVWNGEPYATIPESKRELIRTAILGLIDESAPFALSSANLVK